MSTMDPAGDGGGGPTSIASTDDNAAPVTPSTGIAGSPGSHHQQHPPPSPLSGCYLLVVLPEPHTAQHRDLILNRLSKGFLSWDKSNCHVDLEKELQAFVAQAPEGEEARNGERLIQYATENLVTEVLIHPQTNTLLQCIRNLLASFTKHRHIIHAGYTFSGNGSWILQDGTFSLADFMDVISEHEVQRVLRAYENSVSVDINCAGVGEWSTTRLSKEACTRYCRVRLNPDDVLTAGVHAISSFTNYVGQYLISQTLDQLMEPSDVVGNIRFSHPTLYVFPGGQGDAALFGINGFNMLVDGGFARKACFWDFARHLDRLDAVLITRINNSNVGGMSSVLRKKREMHVYPQIGHFFCNLIERRLSNSPDGDKDLDPLILSLTDIGQDMMVNLRHINLRAHPCYRDPNPINLYHKVGHGTLDMYVLSPSKDSREVKEFLSKWHTADSKLFAGSCKKDSNNLTFPIQNLASICALLVWQPANPEDTITRILFPGSTPQHKIFEGIDRLKHLDFLKHPVCTAKSLSPSNSLLALKDRPAIKQKLSLFEESKKSPDKKKDKPDMSESKLSRQTEELGSKLASQQMLSIQTSKVHPSKIDVKTKKVIENKKIEKDLKESKKESIKKDTSKMEKDTEIRKLDGFKIKMDNEKAAKEFKYKAEAKKKETKEVKSIKSIKAEPIAKPLFKITDKKQKSQMDKKDQVKASPPTPKKFINGSASKVETSKTTTRPTSKLSSKQYLPLMPAKSAKDANNRKVVEQKNIEIASAERADAMSTTKLPAKQNNTERKSMGRRIKPVSPIKTRVPVSPSKSTRSTPTTSVKSDKDSVIKKVKSDRGTTDSSTVSTPSGIEMDSMTKQTDKCLTEKSEDMSLDSIESKVLADLKEEREVVEEIEAVLQKAERIEGTRREDHLDGDDDITAEATDKKDDDITEDDVTADIEELPKKECSRKTSHEITEEDEFLIIEKEEIYIEDSVQSGEVERKHLLDVVESETAKTIKDTVTIRDEKYDEEHTDISEEKEKADAPEKQLDLDGKMIIEAELKQIIIDKNEVCEEDLRDIVVSVTDTAQKADEKDDSGKKDSEDVTKEPSSLSPDKFDSLEKKINDTDVKTEFGQKDQQLPEKLEESHEKMSTLESGATTTAPTLPEDERIPLNDIKEVIDEKIIVDQEQEKDYAIEVKESSAIPITTETKYDPKPFEVNASLRGIQREIVKTPDEVADLPVHEEVDPKLYHMEDFEKLKEDKPSQITFHHEESKEIETLPAKEQKGVFSFFGKVADKFEKGIDKLTGKSRRDSEKDIDEKSSSKSGSPKEMKAEDMTVPSDFEVQQLTKAHLTTGQTSQLAITLKISELEVTKVEKAAINDVANFLNEEIENSQKSTHIDEELKETIDKQKISGDNAHVKLDTEPVTVVETHVPKDKTDVLAMTIAKSEVEEDAEDVEALLEEASKKFITVKDSLHDSLESLEEKIAEDGACIELVTGSKDIVKDTLSEVVEKLEDMKPHYKNELSVTEDQEKIESDIAGAEDIEVEKQDSTVTTTKDLKEAVRDVGELLAGSAGILIEDKPKDVVEIVKKVAEVLNKDDFLSHDALFDKDAAHVEDKVSDHEGNIGEFDHPETKKLKTVEVANGQPLQEEITEILDGSPASGLIDSKPVDDREIKEKTSATVDLDITSFVKDSTGKKIEAIKDCANLMEDENNLSKQEICSPPDSEKSDVLEAGVEVLCVKKIQVHPRDNDGSVMEEPNTLLNRKVSPVTPGIMMVTTDLSPTSSKLELIPSVATEIETAPDASDTLQILTCVQSALQNDGPLENIIEDMIFIKKFKITMEIIEYITLIRKIPRDRVISIIDEVVNSKRALYLDDIAHLDVLDIASPEKRKVIEQYIEDQYLMKNKQITMEKIQEISTTNIISRRIVIEIIEEILNRKKLPRETILDISEEEYLIYIKQLDLYQAERTLERDGSMEASTINTARSSQEISPIKNDTELKNYLTDELITNKIKITQQFINNICDEKRISRREFITILEELITECNIARSSVFDVTEEELSELLASEKERVDKDPTIFYVHEKSDDVDERDSIQIKTLLQIINYVSDEFVKKNCKVTPLVLADICKRNNLPRRLIPKMIEDIVRNLNINKTAIFDISDNQISELLASKEEIENCNTSVGVKEEIFEADYQGIESVTIDKSEIENTIVTEYILQQRKITPYIFEDICIRYKVPRQIVIEIIEEIIMKQKVERNSILDITDTELTALLAVVEAESVEDKPHATLIPQEYSKKGDDDDDRIVDSFITISPVDDLLTENIATTKSVDSTAQETEKDLIDDFEAVEQEYKIDSVVVTPDKESTSMIDVSKSGAIFKDDVEEAIEDDVSDVVEAEEKKSRSQQRIETLGISEKEFEVLSGVSEIAGRTENCSMEAHEKSEVLEDNYEINVKVKELSEFDKEHLDAEKDELTDKKLLSTDGNDILPMKTTSDDVTMEQLDLLTKNNLSLVKPLSPKDLKSLQESSVNDEATFLNSAVRRMVVTASSEDGGHETEVCSTESINLTPEDSLINSPVKTTPDPDSLRFDKELRSGTSTPEKDSISGKSTPGTKDGEKITPEDSLDKSPSGTRDSQDLEDSLDKSDLTKIKELESQKPEDPEDAITNALSKTDTNASTADDGKLVAISHPSILSDTANMKILDSTVEYDISLVQREIKESPMTEQECTLSAKNLQPITEPVKTLSNGIVSPEETTTKMESNKVMLEGSPKDEQICDKSELRGTSEASEKVHADTMSATMAIEDTVDGKSETQVSDEELDQKVDQHASPPRSRGSTTSEKSMHFDMESITKNIAKSTAIVDPIMADSLRFSGAGAENIEKIKSFVEQEASEFDKVGPSATSKTEEENERITGSRSPSPSVDDYSMRDSEPIHESKHVNGAEIEFVKPVSSSIADKQSVDVEYVDKAQLKAVSTVTGELNVFEHTADGTRASGGLSADIITPTSTKVEVIQGTSLTDKDVHKSLSDSILSHEYREFDDQSKRILSKLTDESSSSCFIDEKDYKQLSIPVDTIQQMHDENIRNAGAEPIDIASDVHRETVTIERTEISKILDSNDSKKLTENSNKHIEDHSSDLSGSFCASDTELDYIEHQSPKSPSISEEDKNAQRVSEYLDIKSEIPLKLGSKSIDSSKSPGVPSDKSDQDDSLISNISDSKYGDKEIIHDDVQLESSIINDAPIDKSGSITHSSFLTGDARNEDICSAKIITAAKSVDTIDQTLIGTDLDDDKVKEMSSTISSSTTVSKDDSTTLICDADKELIQQLATDSRSAENLNRKESIDCLRSPCTTPDQQDATKTIGHSTAVDISIETQYEKETSESSRNSTEDQEIAVENDDSQKLVELSQFPSILAETCVEIEPMDHSRSSYIIPEDHEIPAVDQSQPDRSRSCNIIAEKNDEKGSLDQTRSSSIVAENLDEQFCIIAENQETKPLLARSSSSSTVPEKQDGKLPVERSRSSSTAPDEIHEKPLSDDCTLTSDSPEKYDEESRMDQSRSSSIIDEKLKDKSLTDQFNSSSIDTENQDERLSVERSRSSSIVAETQDEKLSTNRQRSFSIALEKGDEKQLIDRSLLSGICVEKHDEIVSINQTGSSSIVDKKADDELLSDGLRLPTHISENLEKKSLTDQCSSFNVIHEKPVEKQSTDQLRSSNIIDEKLDVESLTDQLTSSSVTAVKHDEKPTLVETSSSSVVADKQDEKPLTDRSELSSIITENLNEKPLKDGSRSSSVSADKLDENLIMNRLSSSNIVAEQSDDKSPMDQLKLSSPITENVDEKTLLPPSKSSSTVDKRSLAALSPSSINVAEKLDNNVNGKTPMPPNVSTDEQNEKDLLHDSESMTDGSENSKMKPLDRSESPIITAIGVSSKIQNDVEPIDDARCASIANDDQDEMTHTQRSRSSSIRTEKCDIEESIDSSQSTGITAETVDKIRSTDHSGLTSMVSKKLSAIEPLEYSEVVPAQQVDTEPHTHSELSHNVADEQLEREFIESSSSSDLCIDKQEKKLLIEQSRTFSNITEKQDEQRFIDCLSSSSMTVELSDEKKLIDPLRSPNSLDKSDTGESLIQDAALITATDATTTEMQNDKKELIASSCSPCITAADQSNEVIQYPRSQSIGSEIHDAEKSIESMEFSDIPETQDIIQPTDCLQSPSIFDGKEDVVEPIDDSTIKDDKLTEKETINISETAGNALAKCEDERDFESARSLYIAAEEVNVKPPIDESRRTSIAADDDNNKKIICGSGSSSITAEAIDSMEPLGCSETALVSIEKYCEKNKNDKIENFDIAVDKRDGRELDKSSESSNIVTEKLTDFVSHRSTNIDEQVAKKITDSTEPSSTVSGKPSEMEMISKSRSSSIGSENLPAVELTDHSTLPSTTVEINEIVEATDHLKSPITSVGLESEMELLGHSSIAEKLAIEVKEQNVEQSSDQSNSLSIAESYVEKADIEHFEAPGTTFGKQDGNELTHYSRSPSVVEEQIDTKLLDDFRLTGIAADMVVEKEQIAYTGSKSETDEISAEMELFDRSNIDTREQDTMEPIDHSRITSSVPEILDEREPIGLCISAAKQAQSHSLSSSLEFKSESTQEGLKLTSAASEKNTESEQSDVSQLRSTSADEDSNMTPTQPIDMEDNLHTVQEVADHKLPVSLPFTHRSVEHLESLIDDDDKHILKKSMELNVTSSISMITAEKPHDKTRSNSCEMPVLTCIKDSQKDIPESRDVSKSPSNASYEYETTQRSRSPSVPSDKPEPIDLMKSSTSISDKSINGDDSETTNTVHAFQNKEKVSDVRSYMPASTTTVEDNEFDKKSTVRTMQKSAETITESSTELPYDDNLSVDRDDEEVDVTTKDRSRSHSVCAADNQTSLDRSRTASLYEDKVPVVSSFLDNVITGLKNVETDNIYAEDDRVIIADNDSSRKSTTHAVLCKQVDISSDPKKSTPPKSEGTTAEALILPFDQSTVEQFADQYRISAEEIIKVKEYIINEYIINKEKVTPPILQEIGTLYSMPTHIIFALIEAIIASNNVPRDSVLDFSEEDEADICATALKTCDAGFMNISPLMRHDIETYINEEFIAKNKKISSAIIDEIASMKSTLRSIVRMIIAEMIRDKKMLGTGLVEKDILIKAVLPTIPSPEIDSEPSIPEHISARSTLDDRQNQTDNSISISGGLKSQPMVTTSQLQISEQKRVEIETYVMEECVKKGRKISVLVFEQIMTTMEVSRSVLLKIIENIIVTRKMSRKGMVDDAIYDDVETAMCKPIDHQLSESIEKSETEFEQTKERLDELSGKSTPELKSSGYSTPEVRQYDDKFSKEISSYSTDYESPFHKAFVGGMTEIRTTHITTLSGKSTPDHSVHVDTPEIVPNTIKNDAQIKYEGELPLAKDMTSEKADDGSSTSVEQAPSMLTTHITMSTTASTISDSQTQHIDIVPIETSGTSEIVSHEICEKDESILMSKTISTDLIQDEGPIIIRKVVKREIIAEQPEVITKIIKRTIIDTIDDTANVNEGSASQSNQWAPPDTIRTLTLRSSDIISPTRICHSDLSEIQKISSTMITDSRSTDTIKEGIIEIADVKTITTSSAPVTVPGDEESIHKEICMNMEVVSEMPETKHLESVDNKKNVTEIAMPPSSLPAHSPSAMQTECDFDPTVTDSALEDIRSEYSSKFNSDQIVQKYTTPSLIEDLECNQRSHHSETVLDIALCKDRQAADLTLKTTPDIPTSSLIRDSNTGFSQISGRSTPDKRPINRSITATPEALRSNEVIKTTITTTRTLSEEGDMITTTMEITETTNERGETTILAEKTDVKVEDRIRPTGASKSSFSSGFETVKASTDFSSVRETEPVSPRTDHSSQHSRAGTNVCESSEEKPTYSDEDVPGSPLSTTSQVGYSPQFMYQFGEQRFSKGSSPKSMEFSEADMSSSFYGELPDFPTRVITETASVESGITKDSSTSELSDSDFSFKKFAVQKETAGTTTSEQTSGKSYIDDGDLAFEKTLMEHTKKMEDTSLLMAKTESCSPNGGLSSTSTIDESKDAKAKIKKDPLDDWDTPLGLPSPKPPKKFNLRTIARPNNAVHTSPESVNFDGINDWGEPLRLPSPTGVVDEASNKGVPLTPKRERKQPKKIVSENLKNRQLSESPVKTEKKSKDSKNKIQPVYMDLTYVPHHGNSYYTSVEFFKRVRARYYVFSGTEPSREVYDALLDAKKTWEDKDLEVTMIPTYDTDTLGYWVADNEEALAANHIDLSPSASRCTINLQDHETSCSAYRLEF